MSDAFVANYPEVSYYDHFTFTIDTTLSNDGPVGNIPIYNSSSKSGFSGELLVDWGDGIIEPMSISRATVANDTLHTYDTDGKYTITVWFKKYDSIIYIACGHMSPKKGLKTIVSIDSDFPKKMFNELYSGSQYVNFYSCTHLCSVPLTLFTSIKNSKVKNVNLPGTRGTSGQCTVYAMEAAVFGHSSIDSIMANSILKNLPSSIEKINGMFEDCKNVSHIDSDAFNQLTKLYSAIDIFRDTSISEIPSNLFTNNSNLTIIDGFFIGTKIHDIPSGLLSVLPKLTSAGSLFKNCDGLTQIPERLFYDNKNISCVEYIFSNCDNLQHIPAIIFDKQNSKIESVQGIFSGCRSIGDAEPFVEFYNNNFLVENISNISALFSGTAVTTTNVDVLSLFPNAVVMKSLYANTGIDSIAPNLFTTNSKITDVSYSFYQCPNITSIPHTLFSSNAHITNFSYCFSECSNLTSIPADLFTANTQATNFSYCFYNCSTLTNIPTGLFTANTQATNFSRCFSRCGELTSIPADLFTANMQAMNFDHCFNGCNNITSAVPELWKTHPNARHSRCFYGCTKAANYADIPADWK